MTSLDLGDLFTSFTRTAWRLEALQFYDEGPDEDPQMVAFLAGKPIPPRDDTSWLDLVSEHKKAGRQVSRVRVVERPLSTYVQFELAVYAENIAAGEDVRVVEADDLAGVAPFPEFWLFDGEVVAIMRYDEDGVFLGADKADHIEPYLAIRDAAVAASVAFDDFRS
jgi:hypothetical protein